MFQERPSLSNQNTRERGPLWDTECSRRGKHHSPTLALPALPWGKPQVGSCVLWIAWAWQQGYLKENTSFFIPKTTGIRRPCGPMFSCDCFMVSHFIFTCMIQLDLFWCRVKIKFLLGGGVYEWQRVPIPFVEKTILPALNYFHIFAKNKSYLCRSISRVSILFHWSMCLFLHQISHSLDYCHSIGSLQVWLWDFSNFILLFQNCFSYSSSITFAYKL